MSPGVGVIVAPTYRTGVDAPERFSRSRDFGAHFVTYKVSPVALLNHHGAVPRACRPYRAKTKGKVERDGAAGED